MSLSRVRTGETGSLHVTSRTLERRPAGGCVCVCPWVAVSVSVCQGARRPSRGAGLPRPPRAPPPAAGKPPARRWGARRAPASPDLSAAGGRGRGVTRGRGVGPGGRGRGGAGRSPSGPGIRRAARAAGRATCGRVPGGGGGTSKASGGGHRQTRPQQQQQQQPPPPLQEGQRQQPQRAALGGRALLTEAARRPSPPPPAFSCPRGPRERHGPRTPGGQLSGARRGPGPRRPSPLPARSPGALGRVLRPLRARAARRSRRPRPAARRLPLRPRRPARRHRRPGGPPLAWGSPQPAPSPEARRSPAVAVPGRAAPGVARAQRPGGPGGRPHPGGPGSPGRGGAVGPRDRGPAAADGGRPERAVRAAETRGAAATPPFALEGPVQSSHGTSALTQGPRSPGDGAQLGACTRTVDVGDSGGQDPPAS